jgi:hypothetical protein
MTTPDHDDHPQPKYNVYTSIVHLVLSYEAFAVDDCLTSPRHTVEQACQEGCIDSILVIVTRLQI